MTRGTTGRAVARLVCDLQSPSTAFLASSCRVILPSRLTSYLLDSLRPSLCKAQTALVAVHGHRGAAVEEAQALA